MIVHAPKNYLKIKEIWAFVSVDSKDDTEGIISLLIGNTWMPFIASDEARLESLRELVKKFNIRARLIRFSQREDLEKIT